MVLSLLLMMFPSGVLPAGAQALSDVFASGNASAVSKPADPRLSGTISISHNEWERAFNLGKERLKEGYLEEAERHLLEASRALKREGVRDERLVKVRNLLGQAYLRDNKLLDATEAFTLAQQTARDSGKEKSVEYAATLDGLAGIQRAQGQFRKAEALYQNAISLRESSQGKESPSLAQSYLELAELYRKEKLFAEAETTYKLALSTIDSAKDVPDLTRAYFIEKAGMLLADQGKFQEAGKCFSVSLSLKDKHSVLDTRGDARKLGTIYYRCLNGMPNSAHTFERGVELESIHVKDAVAAATLTAQVYGPDWYLLKAEVTIQNQGKTPITALQEQPSLSIEEPKANMLLPLDSQAISAELNKRGQRAFNRLWHSADYAYNMSSFTVGGMQTAAFTPFGPTVYNSAYSWATFTPDWEARARARNAAFATLARVERESTYVVNTRPAQLTIEPGEAATFVIYYPYKKFDTATLRLGLGNAVIEFPFTKNSG